MTNRKRNRPLAFDAEAFLRSINLCFDAEHPERIAHFRPTTKSAPLLRGVLDKGGERAFLVVAPYGSGKSLTLTYLLNVIENRPDAQNVLGAIESRVEVISPGLRQLLRDRRRRKKQGLVLALHGFQASVPQALYAAAMETAKRNKLGRQFRALKQMEVASIEDAVAFLQALKDICLRTGRDQVCILWDEVGRHLESLISEGRAAELSDIQVLAEYASRSSDVPVTFGITLHQSMLHHAQQMTQSVRAEWLKISGRFNTIQYVDDSKETYRLVAEIVESRQKRDDGPLPSQKTFRVVARAAKQRHGLFGDFNIGELAELLRKAYPLNPATLYVLPRVSARVAQNERTLFTFLYSVGDTIDVDVAALYDYFAPSMRSDTAVGGTYRQWLETESAVSKTSGDEASVGALKTACLLSLGTKGERTRIGKSTLVWALKGYGADRRWKKAVADLIDRKLLLYRTHSKEVSVWHGTDVDIRGRLLDEKVINRANFDLVAFLNQEARPEAWKPIEYNARYGVNRYWAGEYWTAADFEKLRDKGCPIEVPAGCDGKIVYLIAESGEELCDARSIAKDHITCPQLIAVTPSSQLDLRDAALEVWCLSQMQHNSDLTSEDPLVLPEIQQMLDDARGNLQAVLDKLLLPMPEEGPCWFNRGCRLPVTCVSDLRRELTQITEDVFPDTPRIYNELINRHKASGTIVNSRKKLLMGILERHGSPDLGLKSTTPDASMFRTVLCHTGLYRKTRSGDWDYLPDEALQLDGDPGLKKVWTRIREFFQVPSSGTPKSPARLLDDLLRPPFGVRRGLMPILFAAGMKAFARAVSLRKRGEYVADVLPSVIEDLCKNPKDYELEVVDLRGTTRAYFEAVRDIFAGSQQLDGETDAVRAAYDAIQSWLFQLPRAALTADSLSKEAKAFQALVKKARTADPVVFLLRDMPKVCCYDCEDVDRVRVALGPLKAELESISHTYIRKVCDCVYQAVSQSQSNHVSGIQELAQQWASYFPDEIAAAGLPSIARGLLSRMRMAYDDESLFVDSLALLVVGKPVEDWDDSTAIEFESRLQELTHKIETVALRMTAGTDGLGESQEIREGFSRLVTSRIKSLHAQLVQLVGRGQSRTILEELMEGEHSGDAT